MRGTLSKSEPSSKHGTNRLCAPTSINIPATRLLRSRTSTFACNKRRSRRRGRSAVLRSGVHTCGGGAARPQPNEEDLQSRIQDTRIGRSAGGIDCSSRADSLNRRTASLVPLYNTIGSQLSSRTSCHKNEIGTSPNMDAVGIPNEGHTTLMESPLCSRTTSSNPFCTIVPGFARRCSR